MTLIWLVKFERFLQEYTNHIKDQPIKYVNWMVQDGNLRFYIEQTNGTNSYCYIHSTGIDTVPIEIQDMMSKKGEIVGIEGIDSEDDDGVVEKLDEISKRLKFGQIGQKQ